MNTTNYKSFSVRHDYEQPKPIQHESMDDDLRIGLWNVFYQCFPDSRDQQTKLLYFHAVFKSIWMKFLKHPSDEYEGFAEPGTKDFVKNIFLSSEWHKVINLIEFIIRDVGSYNRSHRSIFINQCNRALKKENSAYKIVGDLVTPITNQQEIQTIESAMATPYEGAASHINKALSLLSRRENPDYRNSIKESISAVESIVRQITDEDSFGAGVDNLERCGIKLHGAHQAALKKLYGFTSDADGIRHASTNSKPLEINQNTARFMLVTCSAFVNYIISEKDN